MGQNYLISILKNKKQKMNSKDIDTKKLWELAESGSPIAKALALTILDGMFGGKIRQKLRESGFIPDKSDS